MNTLTPTHAETLALLTKKIEHLLGSFMVFDQELILRSLLDGIAHIEDDREVAFDQALFALSDDAGPLMFQTNQDSEDMTDEDAEALDRLTSEGGPL